jgi:hypothetical protein
MRNRITSQTIAVLILCLTAVTAQAQSSSDKPQNEIEVRATYTIPKGEADFSGTTSSGSTISLDRDFDFKNEFGYEIRFTHRSANGKHKFLGSYAHTGWERNTMLSRSFTFRGQTYVANLNIDGDLRLNQFRGMYSYRWGNEKFRFGPMVDMGVITTKLNLTGTTNNGIRSTEGSISKFAATVGYDLDYDPSPKLNIFNSLGAIAFKGEHLFHVEGGVKYFFSRQFAATGGYKAIRYKLVDNDNFITIKTHGPFVGGVFRF